MKQEGKSTHSESETEFSAELSLSEVEHCVLESALQSDLLSVKVNNSNNRGRDIIIEQFNLALSNLDKIREAPFLGFPRKFLNIANGAVENKLDAYKRFGEHKDESVRKKMIQNLEGCRDHTFVQHETALKALAQKLHAPLD